MMRGNNEEECGGLAAFKRNKYFYGKLLTVRDFEDEQNYVNKKRYLINKAIHGIGLVCGLKVSNPGLEDSRFTIDLTEGVALDCCGHEIVVSHEGTKEVHGLPTKDVEYLYVKYKEEPIEPVPVPANTSSCEEICCGNRILERFELEFGPEPPEPSEEAFIAEDLTKRGIGNEYYETKLLNCPVCDDPTDPRVFLAVITKNGDDFSIDEEETKKYRSIVYNNPMLYELLSSHIVDRNNPHEVTAEQVRALKSVNDVGNVEEEYVSNIDLFSNDDTIRVEPEPSAKQIDLTLNDDSVGTGHIKDDAVTAAKIGTDAVTTEKIKNSAVTAAKIGTDAVTTEKIKNSAVTAAKIAKGTIKDEKIADDAEINEGKIRHLALVYENIKERSLKCIVDSFREIYGKFEIELALRIVEAFKEALNEGYYKDDKNYIKFIKESLELLDNVAEELKGVVPEERLKEYRAAVKELVELLGQKEIIPVEIASAVEEVCFYARWLIPPEVTPEQIKALMSVNGVGNVEDNEWVRNIDLESGDGTIGISPNVSEDKIDLKVNDGSINDEKIAEEANINERKIRHLTLVYENIKERSLKCIVDSFLGVYNKFEGDAADAALLIVKNFKEALNEGYYTDDENYIKFITDTGNLYEPAKDVGTYVKEKVPKELLDEYIAAVREFGALLGQAEIIPVEIASAVEEVCFYARWLVPHVPARVVTINWNHNGDTLIDQIGSPEAVALAVKFDRDMMGASINEHTFLSMVKWEEEETGTFRYDYIRGDIDVGSETTTKEAKFIIKGPGRFIGHEIKMVLKGDFILDIRGKALDGNFIGGKLPSGNGYQGGDFESWFTLTHAAGDTVGIGGRLFRRLEDKEPEPYPKAPIKVYESGTVEEPVAEGSSDEEGNYCIDNIPTSSIVDIIIEEQPIDGEYRCKRAEMTKIDTGTTPGSCSDGTYIKIKDVIAECSPITARAGISGEVVTRLPFQLVDEPLSDASVTVYESANPDKSIANGSTDDSGVYCIDDIPLETHVDIFVARGEQLHYKAEMKDIATGKTPGNCKAGNCVEIVKLVGQ
jgi:hypothetical protein